VNSLVKFIRPAMESALKNFIDTNSGVFVVIEDKINTLNAAIKLKR
jgi:hypothetical protein